MKCCPHWEINTKELSKLLSKNLCTFLVPSAVVRECLWVYDEFIFLTALCLSQGCARGLEQRREVNLFSQVQSWLCHCWAIFLSMSSESCLLNHDSIYPPLRCDSAAQQHWWLLQAEVVISRPCDVCVNSCSHLHSVKAEEKLSDVFWFRFSGFCCSWVCKSHGL